MRRYIYIMLIASSFAILSGCSPQADAAVPFARLYYQVLEKFKSPELKSYEKAEYAYWVLKDYELARSLYQETIDMEPGFPIDAKSYLGLGSSYRQLEMYEEAVAAFDKAVELGYCQLLMGRYEESIENFDKPLECNPNYHGSIRERPLSYECMGRYDDAIESLKRFIIDNPRNYKTLRILARLQTNNGRYEEAFETNRLLLDIDPDTDMIKRNITAIKFLTEGAGNGIGISRTKTISTRVEQ